MPVVEPADGAGTDAAKHFAVFLGLLQKGGHVKFTPDGQQGSGVAAGHIDDVSLFKQRGNMTRGWKRRNEKRQWHNGAAGALVFEREVGNLRTVIAIGGGDIEHRGLGFARGSDDIFVDAGHARHVFAGLAADDNNVFIHGELLSQHSGHTQVLGHFPKCP